MRPTLLAWNHFAKTQPQPAKNHILVENPYTRHAVGSVHFTRRTTRACRLTRACRFSFRIESLERFLPFKKTKWRPSVTGP